MGFLGVLDADEEEGESPVNLHTPHTLELVGLDAAKIKMGFLVLSLKGKEVSLVEELEIKGLLRGVCHIIDSAEEGGWKMIPKCGEYLSLETGRLYHLGFLDSQAFPPQPLPSREEVEDLEESRFKNKKEKEEGILLLFLFPA